jgi:methylated-DNA-[protein]-cysteine S-methyltransferase
VNKRLHQQLQHRNFDELADAAGRKRRILGSLISMTFDPDPLIGWRAVEAMGAAACRIAENDPDYVRQHLRRLYWLLSEESGGICWRAPEAMAEIVRHKPKMFADYIPIVVSLIQQMAKEDLIHFRAGILWAIGRLGPLAGDHAHTVLTEITSALDDSDPQVRGMAVWCLGQLRQTKFLAHRPDLLSDQGPVDLYQDGFLNRTSVGHLAQQAFGHETVEE